VWAKRLGKPIIPIAATGGTAEEIWEDTIKAFDDSLESAVDQVEYENLNSANMTPGELADHAVQLAVKLISQVSVRDVFVAMAIVDDAPILQDVLETFKRVSDSFDLNCHRIDEMRVGRISLAIEEQIRNCRFLFVDLTGERPNVYYELGYAVAFGKPVILTAHEGTRIHFDIHDYQVIFYRSATELETAITPVIREIVGQA
jgi:hypothetical protein